MKTVMRFIIFASLFIFVTVSAPAAPLAIPSAMDIQGKVQPLISDHLKGAALIFVSTECPIGNRYIPSLNAMAQSTQAKGVPIYAVISDRTVTRAAAKEWQTKYAVSSPFSSTTPANSPERSSPPEPRSISDRCNRRIEISRPNR